MITIKIITNGYIEMADSIEKNTIEERVLAACNELYAGGTKPTVRLVLSMLPDISSTSTIHKYFALWKEELEANQKSLYDKLGFSSGFTQSFMKEITRFSVEAEQRYKEQAQDANEQRDVAIDGLSKSEDRLHKQNALIEQNEKEIKELQSELIKVQEKSKAELASLEKSNEVIVTELRQQLVNSTNINDALSKTNEALRTDISKAELKLEGNQEYVAEVKTQNSSLNTDNKALNAALAELTKTVATQEAVLSGNEKLIKNLESATSSAQKEASKSDSERLSVAQLLETTRSHLDDSKEQLAQAIEKMSELRKTVDEQSTVIAKLTA
tara:strand:+ start:17461 stop:18441 length:981 start_codon:yes stop_codon:yes gene_type:complete